jgi:hypothetical protein
MDKLNDISVASVLALALVLPVSSAGAEEPELVTDRPDFTESSVAVTPGHVQAELGMEASLGGAERELVFPALLLRVGVARHLELRVGAPSATVTWTDGAPDAEASVAPLELGAKLATPVGSSGDIGVMPYVSLPVRASQYDTDGVSVGLKGLWSVDLTSRLSLGGNVGVELLGLGVETGWEASASLSLGIGLTGRLGTFVELYGLFDAEEARPYAQTGLTYSLLDNLQLDLYGAVLLDDGPGQGVLGTGASVIF